jgi:hypothetical protein
MEDNFSLDALKTRIGSIDISEPTLSRGLSEYMVELTAIADERLKIMQTEIQAKKQRLSVNEINGIEKFINEYLVGINEFYEGIQKYRSHDRRELRIIDVLLSSIQRIQQEHLRLINASNGLITGQKELLEKKNILNIIGTLIQSNETCMRSLYIALNPVVGGGILRRRRRKQRAVTYKKVANRKKQRRNTKKQRRTK